MNRQTTTKEDNTETMNDYETINKINQDWLLSNCF